MDAVKINEHTTFIPFDPIWRVWNPRYLFLPNNRRHSFCPSCSQTMPWPEQIGSLSSNDAPLVYACDHCNAVMRYDPDSTNWIFQESTGIKENTCPECGGEKEKRHESLPGFYICEHCDVEFKYTLGSNKDGLICTKFKKNEAIIMITKVEMNEKYATPDPFGVKNDPADAERKRQITTAMKKYMEYCGTREGETRDYFRALDIGCGEGFITKDIPADEIVGYDVSDIALSRIPGGTIVTVDHPSGIEGKFDLILVAGCLVEDYDYRGILALVEKHACGIVITCSTDITEVPQVLELKGEIIEEIKFPYRANNQILRVFDYSKIDGDQNDSPVETEESIPDSVEENESPVKEGSGVTLSDDGEEKFSGEVSEKPLAIDAPIEVNVIEHPIENLSELPQPDLSQVEDIKPDDASGSESETEPKTENF